MRKIVETRSSLSNTIKDTSTIMGNPLPEGVTHDCAGILDSIAKGSPKIVLVSLIVLLRELLVSSIFCMVHPYIAIHSGFTHLCALRMLAPRLVKKVKWRRKSSCLLVR